MTIDTMIYDNINANNGDQYDDNVDQDEDEMMLRRLPRHPRGASQGALSICIARTRQQPYRALMMMMRVT